MIYGLIALGVIVLIAIFAIAAYNNLVALRAGALGVGGRSMSCSSVGTT